MSEGLAIGTLTQLAYALGIGVLIGLERSFDSGRSTGSAEAPPEGSAGAAAGGSDDDSDAPGVRTFSVLSMSGFVAALLGEQTPLAPLVVLLVVGLVVVAFYVRAPSSDKGITTEIAAVVTCVLGALCRTDAALAAVIAVVVTAILASKRFTHRTVGRMRRSELNATVQFLVLALIVLPLLPDEPLDPYGALNPHSLGLLVMLLSGISFVGYVLTRVLGPQRGLVLTGVIGGLTSSTAVTAALARQASDKPALVAPCVAGTVAANATMFVRVLVVVAVLDPSLSLSLGASIGVMAVAMTGVTAWAAHKSAQQSKAIGAPTEVDVKNPLSLGPAAEFAGVFVGVKFLLGLAERFLGDRGVYVAAGLSGLVDVDAVSLSLAQQASAGSTDAVVAAIAITLAVASNTVSKTGIALWMGGARFGRSVGLGLGAATLLGMLTGGFALWMGR